MSAAGVGRAPVQALGRDVGERSGHVALRRQRLGLLELRQAEVGEAGVDLVAVLTRRRSPA